MQKRNKMLILVNMILSLCAVGVAAISTFAWFQINSQAPEATIQTKDPNLLIDNSNVTGYKVVPTIGSDGFIDNTSTTITSKKGQTYDTSNNHQDKDDSNFDIPYNGLGYYLVKKNPGDSYRYRYNNKEYAVKFEEYSSSNLKLAYDEDICTFTATDRIKIRQYTYDTTNYKSVNKDVFSGITLDSSSETYVQRDTDNDEFKILVAGTYKVWFYVYSSYKTLTFEPFGEASKQNAWTSDPGNPPDPEHVTGTSSSTDYTKITLNNTDWDDQYRTIHIYNISFDTSNYSYSNVDLEYFLTKFYGNEESGTWSFTRVDKGWKTNGSRGDYFLAGNFNEESTYPNYHSGSFYLPKWINYCQIALKNSNSSEVYLNYLNNLYSWAEVSNGSTTYHSDDSSNIKTAVGKTTTIYARNVWNKLQFKIDNDNNPANNASYNYTTKTVITKYVDTNGNILDYYLTGKKSSIETSINVNCIKVPSNPSINGYTFSSWKYSRTNTFSSLNDTTAGSSLQVQEGFTLYAIFTHKASSYAVAYIPSYFVTNDDDTLTHLNLTDTETGLDILREEKSSGASLSSKTFSAITYRDNSKSILYRFTREGGNAKFYTTSACTTEFTGTITADTKVYAKMVCPKLYTFYIESQSNYNWPNTYVHAWGSGWSSNASMGTDDLQTIRVKTMESTYYLFRTSLPSTLTGLCVFNGLTGDLNQTSDITSDFKNNSIIQLGGESYGHRYWGWRTTIKETLGRAYIQKYNGSTWDNVANGEMDTGDGIVNNFIFEKGIVLNRGDNVRVAVTSDGGNTYTYYGYSKYVETNINKHPYISSGSNDGINLTNFTGSARFNFYITSGGKISIAMVPGYGNGFYIVPFNTSIYSSEAVTDAGADLDKLTQHYCGAIKMDSNDYSAIYTGFYSDGGSANRIFIRSYLNAVDTLIVNKTTSTPDSVAEIDHGVITLKESGRYTIQVTNSTVEISAYQVKDFFQLNALDVSKVTGSEAEKQTAIYNQKTSLIMEIPFTCNNPYASTITLTSNCNESYIGLNLYVSSSPLGTGATIYDTLRGASSPNSIYTGLTAANTATPITNKNSSFQSIPKNSTATFYAYILIDYMPSVTSSDITGVAPVFKIYLHSNQP